MEGACGTWRGKTETTTAAGSGMEDPTAAGEKGDEDETCT
jgi:hypothetical protein